LRAWAAGPGYRARGLSKARRTLGEFRPARFCRRFYYAEEFLIIRYRRDYPFAIQLLLEHYLKVQHTNFETPRAIMVPKNLDFTDPVNRKKLDVHSQNSAPDCNLDLSIS
jgi:hypothetical protein